MKFLNFNRAAVIIALTINFFLSILLWVSPVDEALAMQAEDERTTALTEGAQKEGKVLLYTTANIQDATMTLRKFSQRYPFIKADFYRAGSENLMTRALLEQQSKKYLADVIIINSQEAQILKDKQVWGKYFSPHREYFVDKDPEGYWTDLYLTIITSGYNTRLVSPRDAPKTWNSLIDPKWKGKMGMDTKSFYWFAAMLKMMGEEQGLEFMRKLAEQKIQYRTGMTLNAQMMAAGEISVGVTIYNYRVEKMKSEGAPIEWIAMDPVIPEIHPVGITSHAPHPNAAKLLVDWLLSRDGQEALAAMDRVPSRIGVDPMVLKLKKGLKIAPYDFSIAKDYQRYVNLYRKIFIKQ